MSLSLSPHKDTRITGLTPQTFKTYIGTVVELEQDSGHWPKILELEREDLRNRSQKRKWVMGRSGLGNGVSWIVQNAHERHGVNVPSVDRPYTNRRRGTPRSDFIAGSVHLVFKRKCAPGVLKNSASKMRCLCEVGWPERKLRSDFIEDLRNPSQKEKAGDGKKRLRERSVMYVCIYIYTSSTAQGGGGSFKNRKPIGEIGCCESGMAERSH